MATNVSEKDKTLNEIIDWCEQLEIDGLRLANALLMQRDTTAYGVVKGQIDAYGKTADHCRSMLGYSGNMPSEVPNQSEDAKMSKRYKVCPLFWSDYGGERTLMNMGVFEELLNEGWQILRVDTMPPTELRDNAVAATNVYILEREANDD
jgi:hypothetical protein